MKTRCHGGSFLLFLRSAPAYQWHLPRHALVSRDLSKILQQVRSLRRNLLHSFTVLNDFEKIMLEAEYVNWMTDQIAHCWDQESRLKKVLELAVQVDGAEERFDTEQEKVQVKQLAQACDMLSKDLDGFLHRPLEV